MVMTAEQTATLELQSYSKKTDGLETAWKVSNV